MRKKLIDKDVLAAEIKTRIETYNKGYANGDDCRADALETFLHDIDTLEVKEVDLENSMVCKVGWYDGFFLDYTQEQQDALLEKIGATCGEKIRVILIKE